MVIKVVCPECNKTYNIPDQYAGKQGRCTNGHLINIPEAPLPPASPVQQNTPPPEQPAKSDVTETLTQKRKALPVIILFICLGIGLLVLINGVVPKFLTSSGDAVGSTSKIKPSGYFVAESLQGAGGFGGTSYGDVSLKDGKVFLVIVSEVPRDLFHPSESDFPEFKKLLTKGSELSDDEKNQIVSRNQILLIDSQKFSIILSNGKKNKAHLIAKWQPIPVGIERETYSPSLSMLSFRESKESMKLAVAWVLEPEQAKLSFKISNSGSKPVSVPDEVLEPTKSIIPKIPNFSF